MRHELGVPSQRLRADAAALKFRNNILSLPEDEHLVARVYRGLRKEQTGRWRVTQNGACALEQLAGRAGWAVAVSQREAKRLAAEYVAACQNEKFHVDLERMSHGGGTLVNLTEWVDGDRRSLPEYLTRHCPAKLRAGRSLKTRFRLGCHMLQHSRKRWVKTRHDRCPCCREDISETIQHAMFECPEHKEIRDQFIARCSSRYPSFATMDTDERTRLLMADDTPRVLDGILYRYLIFLSASRGRSAGRPGHQGESLRATTPS